MSVNSHSLAFLKRPDINAAADVLVREAPEVKEEKRMRTKEKGIRSEDCPALRPFCEKHKSAS
jgi:hypothetical protein